MNKWIRRPLLIIALGLAPFSLHAKTLLHTLTNNQWRQIALPATPIGGATPRSLWGDDLNPADYRQTWALFGYDPATKTYSLIGLDSALTRGKAYWMIQTTGATVTLDYDATVPDPAGTTEVPLSAARQANWNMIGHPGLDRMPFRQIGVKTISGSCANAGGCSISAATESDIVHDSVWSYGPSGYVKFGITDTLSAWQGFWVATLPGADGRQPHLLFRREYQAETADRLAVGQPYERAFYSTLPGASFAITSSPVPVGMTINPRTGHLYWTPTPDQSGHRTVTIAMSAGGATETTTLNLDVATGDIDTTDVFFLAPTGIDSKKTPASYAQPSQSTRYLCKDQNGVAKTFARKTTFYYRGGVYHNPDFGQNITKHKSRPAIICNGKSKAEPLIIKPWGNEKPKIKFDSPYGLQVTGNNIILEDFEIEGMSQEITYDQAVGAWWTGGSRFNGLGLSVAGEGVTIRNNIIHDTPGAGINSKPKTVVDDMTIENNIIFNASWWSTGGTTALGIVGSDGASDTPGAPSKIARIKIRDNLVFSSESRIFSHVFSKGFSHLVIDEGSSMLLKQFKGKYKGSYDQGFLVRNNFFLFNGKGVSLRWRDIRLLNNTLYNNGTTITGAAGGLRSNAGKQLTLTGNAVFVDRPGLKAVDFSPDVTIQRCADNRLYKGFSGEQGCAAGQNNNQLDPDMFANPTVNDFTTVDGSGASMQTLLAHQEKLAELGHEIRPANFKAVVDQTGIPFPVNSQEYIAGQQQKIVDIVPREYDRIIKGDFDNKGDLNDYKIIYPDENNVTGNKTFILKID